MKYSTLFLLCSILIRVSGSDVRAQDTLSGFMPEARPIEKSGSPGALPAGVSSASAASLPLRMSYQGLLTTSGGDPVADGSYDVTVELYDSIAGGILQWSEAHASVPVEHGAFSITLGATTPLSLQFDRPLFLQVIATGGPAGPSYPLTFSPRSELTSAPYSLAPWVTDSGAIYYNNGLVGIGTAAPGVTAGLPSLRLEIADENGLNSDIGMRVAGGGYPIINMTGSQGSLASPLASNPGDILGSIRFAGYDGGILRAGAHILAIVDSTPAVGRMPGRLSFYTQSTLGGTVERMRLDRNGTLFIDYQNLNNGTYTPGLVFGSVGSGEGIGSNRASLDPSPVNLWGLDFYTSYTKRMSINNFGYVGIGTATPLQLLSVNGSMDLSGGIYRGAATFLHDQGLNCFFGGLSAGQNSNSGAGSGHNVGIGTLALSLNTTGSFNTAIGASALRDNVSGTENTAAGYHALLLNTGSLNSAYGSYSLQNNSTGPYNTASGSYSLYSNTSGGYNTAVGYSALSANGPNSANTAVGFKALEGTSASDYNTAVGANAGRYYNNGYNNVFVGANTDVDGTGYYNVIAIGQGTIVSASSTARFGNAATGSYGGWAGWSNVSDGRFKKNVKEDVPGLAFITQLRPVTYNFDATGMDAYLHKNDANATSKGTEEKELSSSAAELRRQALMEKEKVVYTGFVAQEVEAAARGLGFDFSGVDAPAGENGYYSLRYGEFVVPLVAAVQEQQKIIDELRKRIDRLEAASNARK